MWTELSSPQNLDPITWPRAAASAEVFWSFPVSTTNSSEALNTSATNALARMHDVRYRMVQRGVNAIVIQAEWCALRDGLCNA